MVLRIGINLGSLLKALGKFLLSRVSVKDGTVVLESHKEGKR